MGEIVEFPSNGMTAQGYLATPSDVVRGGVVVIQEWWGLVDHIKDVCERFAGEGFVALAPDFYRGEATTEPDEAGKLMMALDLERAAKDMGGAVELVAQLGNGNVGVIGFCMGGGLALVLGAQQGAAVKAVVPFYGLIPWPGAQPDYSGMKAAVQGHYAADDDMADPESVRRLEAALRDAGVEVTIFSYPGTQHAFFNDQRPEVHDPEAAALAWTRVLKFFRDKLG